MPPEETKKLTAEVTPSDGANVYSHWQLYRKIDESGSDYSDNYEAVGEVESGNKVEYQDLDDSKTYKLDLEIQANGGTKYSREGKFSSHNVFPSGKVESQMAGSTAVPNTDTATWLFEPKS